MNDVYGEVPLPTDHRTYLSPYYLNPFSMRINIEFMLDYEALVNGYFHKGIKWLQRESVKIMLTQEDTRDESPLLLEIRRFIDMLTVGAGIKTDIMYGNSFISFAHIQNWFFPKWEDSTAGMLNTLRRKLPLSHYTCLEPAPIWIGSRMLLKKD